MEVNAKRVAVIKSQATKAENILKGFVIKDQASYEVAGSKYIALKKLQKDFLAEERSWLKPINELRNKVFSYTRPARAKIAAALEQISDAMQEYEQRVEAKRLADTNKLEDKVKSGELTLAEATDKAGKLDTVASVESLKGKMHTRQQYILVVENKELVPEQFKIVDMTEVNRHYTATGQLPAGIALQTRSVRVARTV